MLYEVITDTPAVGGAGMTPGTGDRRTTGKPPGTSASGKVGLSLLFAAAYSLGMPGYDIPGLPFACLVPFLLLVTSARSGKVV